MRRSILAVQDRESGKWIMLGDPGMKISEQKGLFKKIQGEDEKKYSEAVMYFSPGKRVKFGGGGVVKFDKVDDLTSQNEAALISTIQREGLGVKIDKNKDTGVLSLTKLHQDHEKARDAIRKAREARKEAEDKVADEKAEDAKDTEDKVQDEAGKILDGDGGEDAGGGKEKKSLLGKVIDKVTGA